MITENGWPSCGIADCDSNPIPGTNFSFPLQRGVPNRALKAFFGDLNWYVEAYNGRNDIGGWTPTNSVPTSNHLGGTAGDYNWEDHPMGPQVPDPAAGWQWSEICGGPEEPRVRELLDYYTFTARDGTRIQIIWWANDWDSPHDSMHFQMGYDTYKYRDEVSQWLDEHLNPDGSSKFRQFKASQLPDAAAVLKAATGLPNSKVQEILPALSAGLVAAQCTNPNRIAMFIAQTREESANYSTTVEFGDLTGEAFYPYIGRTWIQITWQSNYAAFGKWAAAQGFITDPNQFVANPDSLADIKWAGVGAAWYWTVARPTINTMCDSGDIVGVTRAINGGTNGLDTRTQYWNQARAQGDSLLALIHAAPSQEDDPLSDPHVVQMIQDIHDKMCGGGSMPPEWASRGMFVLATDKPGGVDDTVGMLLNTDGNVWSIVNILGALLGVEEDVQRMKDTAAGKFPDGLFVSDNEWLKARSIEFATKLVPLCGLLNPAAFGQVSAPPAKATKGK